MTFIISFHTRNSSEMYSLSLCFVCDGILSCTAPTATFITGRTLTICGQAVVETENSKSSHEMSMEYQLPEDVELEALESSLSNEGLLTVEAPRNPAVSPEAPKSIPIIRDWEPGVYPDVVVMTLHLNAVVSTGGIVEGKGKEALHPHQMRKADRFCNFSFLSSC